MEEPTAESRTAPKAGLKVVEISSYAAWVRLDGSPAVFHTVNAASACPINTVDDERPVNYAMPALDVAASHPYRQQDPGR